MVESGYVYHDLCTSGNRYCCTLAAGCESVQNSVFNTLLRHSDDLHMVYVRSRNQAGVQKRTGGNNLRVS